MIDDSRRRTPDELLAEIELEDRRQQRGQLKLFLGYASGVGKSFQMLDEGRRRRERGEDVIACALQPDYPPEVKSILQQMEVVPMLRIADAEVIDVDSVIARRPQVVLIDGLAYDNPPGSRHPHRWQDVEQLLDAGISVLTTVNIQYLENLQDEIERITGKRATHIIPWSFVDESVDEIAVVDAPSVESFPTDEQSSRQLVEKHQLSRLRELALLVAASVVDRQLVNYLRAHGTEQTWGVFERILVYITAESNAAEMLESGRRNADRFQGEFYAVYMNQNITAHDERAMFETNLQYARRLGAEVYALPGNDVVQDILDFAHRRCITQIFVARPAAPPSAFTRLRGDRVQRLIRAAEGIDVVVYPN